MVFGQEAIRMGMVRGRGRKDSDNGKAGYTDKIEKKRLRKTDRAVQPFRSVNIVLIQF